MTRNSFHRILSMLAAAALAAALAACGSSAGRAPQNPEPAQSPAGTTTGSQARPVAGSNKRDAALGCIHARGIEAQPAGEKSIIVNGPAGPRIDFFQSSLEAEGEQFEGNGEGAEQVGAALLYVRDGSEELLTQLELCLNEQ